MSPDHKPLVWLTTKIKTPPVSLETRTETGFLLRLIQSGTLLHMPHSRPMPIIGRNCHELRITDSKCIWRIFYRVDVDAILIIDWDNKKTEQTTKAKILLCKKRIIEYDNWMR
jgi:phage-related protein